jgi:DNA-binding IclR family transcriptional regulator
LNDTAKVTLTLERGLEVLRAFHAERIPLSNAELVRRTGHSKATISRLTTTLLRVGFLRRVGGGRLFELATGALSLGHTYLQVNPISQLAQPVMQALADKLNVSVALATPDHLDMLYIGYCTGARIATLRLGVGSLLPMGSTSVGRAYMWGLPPTQRRACVASVKAAAGPNSRTVQNGIDEAFRDLEENGVSMSVGDYQRDAYGIALPLEVGIERALMTLSCGAVELEPNVVALRRRIVPALKAAAEQLNTLLRDVEGLP